MVWRHVDHTIPRTSGTGSDSVPVLKNLMSLVPEPVPVPSHKKQIRIRPDIRPWISKSVRTRTFSVLHFLKIIRIRFRTRT